MRTREAASVGVINAEFFEGDDGELDFFDYCYCTALKYWEIDCGDWESEGRRGIGGKWWRLE
jgi:hypothetical protein